MKTRLSALAIVAAAGLAACGPSKEHARADSATAAAASEQTRLATQLAAQKDSLTRVVLQADEFIIHIDSSISKVKGLPKGKEDRDARPARAADREPPRGDGARGRARRARAADGVAARPREQGQRRRSARSSRRTRR